MARTARNQGERRGRDGDRGRDREESEFAEKLVNINRVAKVVKGGRRFGFAALVVVGDRKGRVGYGAGKAREVPEAIRKATEQARRNMIRVPLREGRTLHHDIVSGYGAGRVIVRAAKAGTGIIAGGPMRAIFEALGVHDVVAKSVGSANPHNMIKATFAALGLATSPRAVAARRGKKSLRFSAAATAKQRGSRRDGGQEIGDDRADRQSDRSSPRPGGNAEGTRLEQAASPPRSRRHAGCARDDPQGAASGDGCRRRLSEPVGLGAAPFDPWPARAASRAARI